MRIVERENCTRHKRKKVVAGACARCAQGQCNSRQANERNWGQWWRGRKWARDTRGARGSFCSQQMACQGVRSRAGWLFRRGRCRGFEGGSNGEACTRSPIDPEPDAGITQCRWRRSSSFCHSPPRRLQSGVFGGRPDSSERTWGCRAPRWRRCCAPIGGTSALPLNEAPAAVDPPRRVRRIEFGQARPG
jgi:hypothetical protein